MSEGHVSGNKQKKLAFFCLFFSSVPH